MKKLLMVSYWIGIVADALASVLLFSPTIAAAVLQPAPFEISANFLYVARIAGALMLGWTVLLFWAQLKPVERADILLITLFPVVTLLAAAGVLVTKSGQIPLSKMVPMFVLYGVIFGTFLPAYVWAKKQGLGDSRAARAGALAWQGQEPSRGKGRSPRAKDVIS